MELSNDVAFTNYTNAKIQAEQTFNENRKSFHERSKNTPMFLLPDDSPYYHPFQFVTFKNWCKANDVEVGPKDKE